MDQYELEEELRRTQQRVAELEHRLRDIMAGNHENERRLEKERRERERDAAELETTLQYYHDLRLTDPQAYEDAWEEKFGERYRS